MSWFTGTFLPSLEDRYNARGGKLWLTKKQADVCRRYMDFGAVRGAMQHREGGKLYCIQLAPNGCAHFFILLGGWTVQRTDKKERT